MTQSKLDERTGPDEKPAQADLTTDKGDTIRVLLVEDDEDDYFLTSDLLNEIEGTRYEIQWVTDYAEAMAGMESGEHEICLLDYRLGERTGLDLLQEVTERGYRKPVIFMTGQADQETDLKAMEAGAADYLVKGSIDARTLERSIRYTMAQKKAEQQIVFMAYYDNLTLLPNRSLFQDRLRQALEHARRFNRRCCVMFLDLDNFKRVNDTLGHSMGDLLLKEVSERLSHCVRSCDTVGRQIPANSTVARLGGDEFTVLLTEVARPEDASRVAERILAALSPQCVLDGHEIFISVSIGIAIYPDDGADMSTLLKNADAAMYQAKYQGKNNFQHFSSSLNAEALERLTMENKMHKALEKKEFCLHYQPQVDVRTGKIFGMEALLRWHSPELGLISPARFIPIAEENGLICSIGEWVLNAACMEAKGWHRQGLTPRIAVNLSRHQFRQKYFSDSVYAALERSGLEPHFLELEITENLTMENTPDVVATLNAFREKGIRVSLDDFGTGFSSLGLLANLPISAIKADRSFISNLSRAENAAIVEAIIAMARSLKLSLIAEGVETQEQLAFLFQRGCYEVQGFLFDRPLPPEQALELLLSNATKGGDWAEIRRSVTKHQGPRGGKGRSRTRSATPEQIILKSGAEHD